MPRTTRHIRIEGDVAYIPLTKGYEAVIDAADVRLVDGFNWTALIGKSTIYAYRRLSSGAMVYLHRAIMAAPAGYFVDHKDSNGLDNRKCNLRIATRAQNTRNQRLARHNKSGVKGVFFDGRRNNWRAEIKLNGHKSNLGAFKCRTAAQIAYAKASMSLHGEFGRLG